MASVFISYLRLDAEPARRLATALKQAGHHVWFDEWRIEVGSSIVGEINDGLASSRYLVLCGSEHELTAPYVTAEWASAFARQLAKESIKLLPARLTGPNLPAILADRRYADLTADWDRGLADLLNALR